MTYIYDHYSALGSHDLHGFKFCERCWLCNRDATFHTYLGFPTFIDFELHVEQNVYHVPVISTFQHSCVNSKLFKCK